ncbi:LacI family DNA-binding transcriptional regulator [Quadrisphaera oryzae]|uniref:LacI family DNA-binding transcriptional regulator n=1 Tax=Quadrisphaera TaxID=317661 RepID=UPI0016457852|nr:LacI family DNA-binding transcriptional regulator [Quadrisphaera sp. RL12-1S]MBC3761415.1 LacI family DNA-binding transcriptional regulator [Quadrisphaera sp. RL12-1S]
MRHAKVRLRDVAEKARVSSTTASLVLSGRAQEFRIADATRDTVLETARSLGYVRATSKRRSSTAAPPLWSVLLPSDFEAGPSTLFVRGVQQYVDAGKIQVDVVVVPFERGRLSDKRAFASSSFSRGVIMVGLTDEDVAFVDGADFDVPVVLFNRAASGCASIVVDDYDAGQQVAQHFLTRGLERFAVLAPPHTSRALSMRTIGFLDELRRARGGDPVGQVQQVVGDAGDAEGYRRALGQLDVGGGRTGVFVLNDQMVGGLVNHLAELGVPVPDRVELVSYGDNPINTVVRPTVSSVAVPADRASTECARTLHHAVGNREAMVDVTRLFGTHLVLRESSPVAG